MKNLMFILCISILAASFLVLNPFHSQAEEHHSPTWNSTPTFSFKTQTNAQGRFEYQHNIPLKNNGGSLEITGVIVSVKSTNGTWYVVDTRFGQDCFISFNNEKRMIGGQMTKMNNRPVKILAFTQFVL